MTIDADKLRALITKATDSDLSDGGRYFDEGYRDLTQCGHGDTGEYQNRHDGKLVEWLWNNRATILAQADRIAVLETALREAHDTMHETTAVLTASDCAKVAACMKRSRQALGSDT